MVTLVLSIVLTTQSTMVSESGFSSLNNNTHHLIDPTLDSASTKYSKDYVSNQTRKASSLSLGFDDAAHWFISSIENRLQRPNGYSNLNTHSSTLSTSTRCVLMVLSSKFKSGTVFHFQNVIFPPLSTSSTRGCTKRGSYHRLADLPPDQFDSWSQDCSRGSMD